ncbi:MAG: EamA family transporter [Patescibacteria group bacterium]
MWFWFALLAAILGGVENYFNKKALHKVRPILMTWSAFALSLPFVILLTIKSGLSGFNTLFFVGVVGSSVIYIISKIMKNQSMKKSDLSKIIPLTSFGTLITYIFGLLFLSESIHILGIVGLLFISLGTYVLNLDKAKEHFFEPIIVLFKDNSSFVYIIAVAMGSVSSVFDKMGVINTTPYNPALTMLVENILMTVILSILLLKEKGWQTDLKNNFGVLMTYSAIYTVVSFLLFTSFTDGPVALVSGVKKLDLVFTLMIGYFFLDDKPLKHAWIATLLMVIGIVMIKAA